MFGSNSQFSLRALMMLLTLCLIPVAVGTYVVFRKRNAWIAEVARLKSVDAQTAQDIVRDAEEICARLGRAPKDKNERPGIHRLFRSLGGILAFSVADIRAPKKRTTAAIASTIPSTSSRLRQAAAITPAPATERILPSTYFCFGSMFFWLVSY